MPDAPEPARELQFPLYVKAPLILLGLALAVFTIHIASEIIFPLFFAAIFAIMLHPVEQWLLRHRVPKLLAITLTVVLGVTALLGLLYFIYLEASQLSSQMPLFKKKFAQTTAEVHQWLQSRFGVSDEKLRGYLSELGNRASALLGGTLSAVSGLLVVATLIPVYIFLLFLYQRRLVDFLTQVFSSRRQDTRVNEVLHESKATIQSYMVGLLIEASIVATLNTTGLLIIGVPYALLLGVLGALLNFIPYIGGLIAIALPMLMAFVTKPGYGHAIAVLGAYMVIQFIDNHYLIPRIVASKIKVNALVAIVGVLVGNAIGGIAGMFLALPVIAILKIVFDRIPSLKPWGMLLGDEETPRGRKVNPPSKATEASEKVLPSAE
ncbi:AI-2E family transporter [Hymenobacter properus]|uniref:AI-2E family transporter n=1 Tax=Hymenobacter properus TaxID=2791026 RepID=A0A931BBE8_9BACT|nr:AI-2E family transporter [Hymenobacter properus]MBF9140194.1 AI-2E family transporter [Hymenobacter properus]MBR7719001.1 AI-2E family transporter [Microvirga sp. SRT04]